MGKTLKTIVNRAANESLGKCTIFSRKKKLKIRDEEIKQIIRNKYCNEFAGSISRWNFIALQKSIHYS
jgi:hypothetical protein